MPASPSKPPRRRAPRLSIALEGSLIGRRTLAVTALNVSATGCLVRCDARLEPGAILDLKLSLEGQAFTTKTRVTDSYMDGASDSDSTAYLAGLEFLGTTSQAQSLLRHFLERERIRNAHADPPAH